MGGAGKRKQIYELKLWDKRDNKYKIVCKPNYGMRKIEYFIYE